MKFILIKRKKKSTPHTIFDYAPHQFEGISIVDIFNDIFQMRREMANWKMNAHLRQALEKCHCRESLRFLRSLCKCINYAKGNMTTSEVIMYFYWNGVWQGRVFPYFFPLRFSALIQMKHLVSEPVSFFLSWVYNKSKIMLIIHFSSHPTKCL